MKVTSDVIRHEFIGLQCVVAKSPNMNYLGVGGLVVGETKNIFMFQGEDKTRSVVKDAATFNFTFDDGTIVEIEGKLLVGRPEDRLKKSIKRLW